MLEQALARHIEHHLRSSKINPATAGFVAIETEIGYFPQGPFSAPVKLVGQSLFQSLSK